MFGVEGGGRNDGATPTGATRCPAPTNAHGGRGEEGGSNVRGLGGGGGASRFEGSGHLRPSGA